MLLFVELHLVRADLLEVEDFDHYNLLVDMVALVRFAFRFRDLLVDNLFK